MRQAVLAVAAIGGVVALVGFAGAAGASATVDLIWIDVTQTHATGEPICLLPANRNCAPDPRSHDGGATISSVALADDITLGVVLTAGPNGSMGGGVSVNYADALPKLDVVSFQSFTTTLPLPYLPLNLGSTSDRPPYIDNVNAAAVPPLGLGIGLPPGASAYLGTVTFRKAAEVAGTFEISVGTDGPGLTDGVLDLSGKEISASTAFNSAYLVNVPDEPPSCAFEIEVNALRVRGRRVSPGPDQTALVTAKARIARGTAERGTTIDTTLTVEAVDAAGVMSAKSSFPITLRVGGGGKGDRFALNIPQCEGGAIEFAATFDGMDGAGGLCEKTRVLRKECR